MAYGSGLRRVRPLPGGTPVCYFRLSCFLFFVATGTCRTCGAVVAALTYRLRRHAEACFQRATPVGPPQRPMVQKKFAVPKADSNAVRYAIARAIFSMGVPFKCIDNPHFQSMLTRAFPGVDCYPLFGNRISYARGPNAGPPAVVPASSLAPFLCRVAFKGNPNGSVRCFFF